MSFTDRYPIRNLTLKPKFRVGWFVKILKNEYCPPELYPIGSIHKIEHIFDGPNPDIKKEFDENDKVVWYCLGPCNFPESFLELIPPTKAVKILYEES